LYSFFGQGFVFGVDACVLVFVIMLLKMFNF
jgi:hypothetical protein